MKRKKYNCCRPDLLENSPESARAVSSPRFTSHRDAETRGKGCGDRGHEQIYT